MSHATETAPRASVVIPNWNGCGLLPTVLDSLRRQSFVAFETLVVDNGSTDGSLELLAREYPEVRVIPLGENRGFSIAVNAGIRAGRGEFVALVNNDVELDPEWLATMVAGLEADPEAGSAASRIRQYWSRELIDSAGDQIRGVPEGRGYGQADGEEFARPGYVASACAAAAVYRREMLDEIGLLNEDLFAYYEDVELGMRAQLAGYRCRYVPEAIAYHMGSTTSARISKQAAYYRLRNLMQLYLTTLPAGYALRSAPALLRPWLHFGVRGGGVGVVARVVADLVRRLPYLVRRREALRAGAARRGDLSGVLMPSTAGRDLLLRRLGRRRTAAVSNPSFSR